MKISQSQQRLETKGFILGLFISIALHAGVVGAYIYRPATKEVPAVNITKIDLGFFEIGGGLNDAPPVEDAEVAEELLEELEEPVEAIEEPVEEEIIEEIIEPIEEVVEEPEVIEEVVETIEEIEDPIIIEKPKEEPKPEPKPEPKKEIKKPEPKKEKPKPQPKKEVKKQSVSGYNAYNPDAPNKVASSAITGENTMQSLSPSEKADIGAQIQAIIAKEAQKNYPSRARRMNQQGTTTIEFTYHTDGKITNLKVTKSSGHKILDETVLQVIDRVKSRFPKISATTTFTVPIKFTLR
ncbi:MAG: energy transducer TonB [Campylobacteraceae bacterium]|nr:energy transducer TonB [Campylobacteraceae bacterium]